MGEKLCYELLLNWKCWAVNSLTMEENPLFKSKWLPFSDLSGYVGECSLSGEPLFLKCPVSDFVMIHRLILYQMKLHKYLKLLVENSYNAKH